MQHKRFNLSALLFLVFGLAGLQAQTMYVKESGTSQTAYSLNNIQKMTFSSGNLTISKYNSSNVVYALNELRYLSFTEETTGISETLPASLQKVKMFPNPVSTTLNIDLSGISGKINTINIINLDGRVMKTYSTSEQDFITIDLSQFSQGIYLCQYNNGIETKTVKIIKK